MTANLGAYCHTNLLFHSSGGQKSEMGCPLAKIKVLAGLRFLQRLSGRILYLFQLLEAVCFPWLVAPVSPSEHFALTSAFVLT